MRKKSSLNNIKYAKAKPILNLCIACDHGSKSKGNSDKWLKLCIDFVCLDCREKGHNYESIMSPSRDRIISDNISF